MVHHSAHPSTRYQGAVIRDDHILLIKQLEHASGREYWLLPGGRIEPGETDEDCVRRELLEETGLHVQVDRPLLDEQNIVGRSYERRKTYRCSVLGGEARPGHEPEAAYASAYRFTEIGWFDLRSMAGWNEQILRNPMTYALLRQIRAALGYAADDISGV